MSRYITVQNSTQGELEINFNDFVYLNTNYTKFLKFEHKEVNFQDGPGQMYTGF